MEDKKELSRCSRYLLCGFKKCLHIKPHKYFELCVLVGNGNGCPNIHLKTECIPFNLKKRPKKYSLKELYNLWIEWIDKYNISVQKFYEEYGLPGSFIKWLEEREKNA